MPSVLRKNTGPTTGSPQLPPIPRKLKVNLSKASSDASNKNPLSLARDEYGILIYPSNAPSSSIPPKYVLLPGLPLTAVPIFHSPPVSGIIPYSEPTPRERIGAHDLLQRAVSSGNDISNFGTTVFAASVLI